jgi:hypothetical protein
VPTSPSVPKSAPSKNISVLTDLLTTASVDEPVRTPMPATAATVEPKAVNETPPTMPPVYETAPSDFSATTDAPATTSATASTMPPVAETASSAATMNEGQLSQAKRGLPWGFLVAAQNGLIFSDNVLEVTLKLKNLTEWRICFKAGTSAEVKQRYSFTCFATLDPKETGSMSFMLHSFKCNNTFIIWAMYAPDRPFENKDQWFDIWKEAINLKLMMRDKLRCVFETKPEPPESKIISTPVIMATSAVTPTSIMTSTSAPTPAVTLKPVVTPTPAVTSTSGMMPTPSVMSTPVVTVPIPSVTPDQRR